jgi:hypothetical protein
MAVNRKLLTERLNLDPGLKRKTKFGEQSHLKRFWNDSQRACRSGFCTLSGSHLREPHEVT